MPRVCSICTHAQKEEINQRLVAGVPFRTIAAQCGASPSAVFRHKDHVPSAISRAQEVREIAHGQDLLDQVLDLKERACQILDEASDSGDLRTALLALKEARSSLELIAKATGRLAAEQHAHVHLSAPPSASVLAELSASFRSFVAAQKGQSCGAAIEDHLYEGEEALPAGWTND